MKEAGRRVGPSQQAGKAKAELSPSGVNLYFGAGAEANYLRQQQPQSSPPGSVSGNNDENASEYIEWMIREKLGTMEALRAAKKALKDDGWGYSDLRKVSDAD